MKIGLIDIDSHNFPSLPLMKNICILQSPVGKFCCCALCGVYFGEY
ncbi:MAG: hypothetical protein FWG65_03755 [Turicibacter sp.]|nr:hypothetical protein [Turicibacter sp.]